MGPLLEISWEWKIVGNFLGNGISLENFMEMEISWEISQAHFPASRVTYLLPGETTTVSKDGRAVELLATSGAVLGPPWQQAENGYIVRPAATDAGGKGD